MNIYVGNLSRDIVEDDLRAVFSEFGQVTTITIIKDRFTSEPRGFGFVEMPQKNEAQAAITGANGREIKGQSIKVNEARPREGGGGGGGGGDRGRRQGGGGRRGW